MPPPIGDIGPIAGTDLQGIPAPLRHPGQQTQENTVAGSRIDNRPGHHLTAMIAMDHAGFDRAGRTHVSPGHDDIGGPPLALKYAPVREIVERDRRGGGCRCQRACD